MKKTLTVSALRDILEDLDISGYGDYPMCVVVQDLNGAPTLASIKSVEQLHDSFEISYEV